MNDVRYDPPRLIGIWQQRRKGGERERDFPPEISARDILRSENKRCISRFSCNKLALASRFTLKIHFDASCIACAMQE